MFSNTDDSSQSETEIDLSGHIRVAADVAAAYTRGPAQRKVQILLPHLSLLLYRMLTNQAHWLMGPQVGVVYTARLS
jgi:hypothetical protein